MSEPRWMEYMAVSDLLSRFHPANPKDHDINELRESFKRFGYTEAVMLCERTGLLAAGHGRVEVTAADRAEGELPAEGLTIREADGEWMLPVQRGWASKDDVELLAYVITSNRLTETGGWVDVGLADALEQIKRMAPLGLRGIGFTQADIDRLNLPAPEDVVASANRTLAERFLVPPFSVLDARQGYWQERKRAWIALGIRSELGRPQNALDPTKEEHGD